MCVGGGRPPFIWLILLVADPLSGMLWQGIQQPMVRRKDVAPKAEAPAGLKISPKKTPIKHDGVREAYGKAVPKKGGQGGWGWLGKGEQEDGMKDAVRGAKVGF